MKVSRACGECGLYKRTQHPFLYRKEPRWDDPSYFKTSSRILVVGSGPKEGYEEFLRDAPGEGVRNLGSLLEHGEVGYHEALSCPSQSPKGKHLIKCREHTFDDVMAAYKPKVVIAIGGNALYWATGDKEARVHAYRHKITDMGSFTLLTVPHLSKDIRYCPDWNRKSAEDLYDEYFHAFYTADKICKYKGYREPSRQNYKIITSRKEAIKVANMMRSNKLPVAMDVETGNSMHSVIGKTALNPHALTIWHPGAVFLCTSWTFAKRIETPAGPQRTYGEYEYETYVFYGRANCAEANRIMFRPWKDEKRLVVGHNIKFDNNVHYKFHGTRPWKLANIYDTFYHFSLLDQSKVNYGLKPLAKFYFGADDWDEGVKDKLKSLFKELNEGRSKDDLIYVDYRHLPMKDLCWYNSQDTYYTLRLYLEIAMDEAYPQPSQTAVQVCLHQAEACSRLERFGIPLNQKVFDESAQENYLHLIEARNEFFSLRPVKKALARGVEPNIESKKFQEALVEITKVDVPRTPKSKEPSIKIETLKKIGGVTLDKYKEIEPRYEFESMAQMVWWKFANLRKISHKNSNFFDSYAQFIINDFIRPNYRICKSEKGGTGKFSNDTGGGTKTGRISSDNPQGQNLGGSVIVRKNFVAPRVVRMPKGLQAFEKVNYKRLLGHEWYLCEADYNRKELVFLAYVSQDPKMLEIINSGHDMHAETARELFDIPAGEEVPKAKRDIAKNLNFGLVYGQGPKAFAEAAGIKLGDAMKFFAKFHKTFPNVRKFFKANEEKIRNGEIIKTIFGRMRSFLVTGDRRYDQGQEREGNNGLIQGPASDSTTEHLYYIFKILDAKPKLHKYIIPINTVHDSIWFLVRKDKWRPSLRLIKKAMETTKIFPFDFNAKLEVELKIGKSLDKMKEVKVA